MQSLKNPAVSGRKLLGMKKLPVFLLRSRFWGASFIAWFLVLFVLSSFAINKKGIELPTYSDKVAHFGYFACGSFALGLWLVLRTSFIKKRTLALIVILAVAAVGAFDEWHQTFTVGRSGLDLGDWIADICGGIAGWAAAVIVTRKTRADAYLLKSES